MKYKNTVEGIESSQLQGFFAGWPNPPSPEIHLQLLKQSTKRIIAIEESSNQVVGFITAISDTILSAYIPFLEVLPSYQNKGIGKRLVRMMLDELDGIYMIDLMCDKELQPYYQHFGMIKANGMIVRNYSAQAGKQELK
ncbi:GNAT family N-acetyltransferase [Virgibacillus oceani]|uniref:N-acetyltransferase n=1 Tax=Virgibacillus oceani TaxID=1479511 RepID=A0A917HIA9_9BACI|nr:GNAT family N-acetyltransferase [Virgibacillus oceani]GGG80637.1 N-acetyltransferase [Virgibacillus oceani]